MGDRIIKKVLNARRARDTARGPLAAFNVNLPPVKAGPKNSNGPKGGSSKTSVLANRDSSVGEKATPRVSSKATKAKQAGGYFFPRGTSNIMTSSRVTNTPQNNRGAARKKSKRLNYSFLRRLGK